MAKVTNQQLMQTMNALMRRVEWTSRMLDPRRNLDHECGYPETSSITGTICRAMYDRNPIAARVVEMMPTESWAVEPEVYEDEDINVETDFELAFKELSRNLRGEESVFESDEGNPLWEALLRADILSGIGCYGALLLGFDDGLPLRLPVEPKPGRKLLFVRCFDESLADITSYDTNRESVRYGWPETYNLTLADPADSRAGQAVATEQVHWTRVIHLADNLASSEWFGVSRMRPVWDRLLDLRKLYGGSAEMYWRGAFPGISLETIPQLGADVTLDLNAIRDQMEQYMNGLQRYFSLAGMNAKSLAPQVVDPSPQVECQIDGICIKIATPKRVFMGSERGELASSQDSNAWDRRVGRRQKRYVTPRMIVPMANRLIWVGCLPKPKRYCVEWPSLSDADPLVQATIGLKRTQAMVAYVAGGGDVLIEPQNYLTKVVGFTDDEVKEITEATSQHVADGGIEEPEDNRDEAMKDLDLVAREKEIALIGKEQE